MHVSGRDVSSRTRHDKSNSSRKAEEASSRGKCLAARNAREGFDRDTRTEFHGAGDGVEGDWYLADERWILLWPMDFRSDDAGTVLKNLENRLGHCTDTVVISMVKTHCPSFLISLFNGTVRELYLLW